MDSTGEVEQVIQTARLRLVTLVPAVMEAILAGDFETAGSLAGYEIVTGFEAEAAFFNLRQQHLREDPEAVEIGYTIYEAYRRRGFAEEAARGLIDWAAMQPEVERVIASVSSDNAPSLRVVAKLGMRFVKEVMDDEDGPERVFVHDLRRPSRAE